MKQLDKLQKQIIKMESSEIHFTNVIESNDYVTQQLNLLNERLNKGKHFQFKLPKNLNDLQKALQHKNNKINVEMWQKSFPIQRFNAAQPIQVQKVQNHSKKNHKKEVIQRPSYLRSQFNQNQSVYKYGQNTPNLFQVNNSLQKQLKQCELIHQIQQRRNYTNQPIYKRFQTQNTYSTQNGEIQSQDIKRINFNAQKIKQISKGILQQFAEKEVQKYFLDEQNPSKVLESINEWIMRSKDGFRLDKEKVFLIFISEVIQVIPPRQQQQNSIIKIEYLSKSIQEKYYAKYCLVQRNMNLYISIRFNSLLSSKSIQSKLSIYQQQQDLIFWAKCLMYFMCQQKCQTNLLKLLLSKNHQHLVNSINSFYRDQDIKYKNQLKQKLQFSHNIFYRIFLKIIINQPFTSQQQSLLYPEEKDIINLKKLKYVSGFKKSMIFKQNQQKNFDKITQAITDQNVQQALKFIKKSTQVMSFDHILFDFFLQNRENISDIHFLLAFEVLLKNNMLESSIYPKQKWAYKCLQILESFLEKEESINNDISFKVLIKIMVACQNAFQEQQFEHILQCFLIENKKLLNIIIKKQVKQGSYLKNKFSLEFDFLQKVILKSFEENQDHENCMKTLLSSYINFGNNKSKDNEALRNNDADKQEVEERLLQKTKYFLVGLKITINFLFRLLHQQISDFSTQKFQKNFLFYNQILNGTKEIIRKLLLHLNDQKQRMQGINKALKNINQPHQAQYVEMEIKIITRFKARYDEYKKLIFNTNELLQIGQILVNFVYLNEYFISQNDQFVYNVVDTFEKLEQKYEDLLSGLSKFSSNLEKFSIIDQTFGSSFFIRYSQLLKKALQNFDNQKSRKIRSTLKNSDTYKARHFAIEFSSTADSLKKK